MPLTTEQRRTIIDKLIEYNDMQRLRALFGINGNDWRPWMAEQVTKYEAMSDTELMSLVLGAKE